MGATLEEAMLNAEAVLQDAALEAERDGIALSPPSALEDVDVPPAVRCRPFSWSAPHPRGAACA